MDDTEPEVAEDCPEDTGYAPAEQPGEDFLSGVAPVVVSSAPQAGDQAVPPGLTRITVVFSRDMSSAGYSWVNVAGLDAPEGSGAGFEDARTAFLDVTLAPDTTYGIGTNCGNFQNFVDLQGTPAVPWVLAFHAAPE